MTAHLIDLTLTVYSTPDHGQMIHLERIGIPCDVTAPTIESFTTGELAEELTRRLREMDCYGET